MILLIAILLATFAILTWNKLENGILITCALLPSYLIRFNIWKFPTTMLEMMVLIVVAIWILKKSWSRGVVECWREIFLFKKNPLMIAIALFLLAATIGVFVAPDKRAAIGVWKAFYIEPILFFCVLLDAYSKNKSITTKIFSAFGISAFLISLFGLVQYIFAIGIPIPWDIERRITSIFEYPNALALFLEPIIVLSWFQIAKFVKEKKMTKEFFFWICVSLLSIANVVLAKSEAGMAALIVTAIVILLANKTTRRHTIASVLILLAIAFAVPTSRSYLVDKFTFHDWSEGVRLSQWSETVALLKDHPIFGAGLSGYPILLKTYHKATYLEIFQYPHNFIMNIWVELGLIGLIAFAFLAWFIVRGALQEHTNANVIKKQHPSLTPNPLPLAPLFFIFLEMTIHGLVDVPYFKNDLAMMIWIFLALFVIAMMESNKKLRD